MLQGQNRGTSWLHLKEYPQSADSLLYWDYRAPRPRTLNWLPTTQCLRERNSHNISTIEKYFPGPYLYWHSPICGWAPARMKVTHFWRHTTFPTHFRETCLVLPQYIMHIDVAFLRRLHPIGLSLSFVRARILEMVVNSNISRPRRKLWLKSSTGSPLCGETRRRGLKIF